MQYPWLFVGAKVVCVDDGPGPHPPSRIDTGMVKLGSIYTVRGFANRRQGIGILLEEVRSTLSPHDGLEYAWRASRFRPLIDTMRTVEEMRRLMLSARDKAPADLVTP